ncbi:6-bladed beta-propeller [Parabacteroides sp. APC149_11_2_Y6]
MKTTFFTLFLIVLSVGTGCKMNSDQDQKPLPVLDMEAAIGKQVPDTFTWNGIAKRITYVPISTPADKLFGSAQPVYVDHTMYCAVDHKTGTVFRTDKKGKVISSFSRKGHGPGEYNVLTYVHVNQVDSTIEVFDQRGGRHIVYDLDGNLIREIFLKEKGLDTPILISDNYIVARGQNNTTHKLYIADKDFNIRKSLFPMDTTLTEMQRLNLTWQLNYCRNRDFAVINFANEDTVFTVTESGAQPLCIFKKGVYNIPEEELKNPTEASGFGSDYIRTMWLSSIPGYYLISYVRKDNFWDEIWRKSDNQIVSRFSNEDGEFGFPLRLPSGKKIRINARNLYIKGNLVVTSIDAIVAVEGKIPDVDEDDNPVLVVMEIG